jgi:hypothetical protein
MVDSFITEFFSSVSRVWATRQIITIHKLRPFADIEFKVTNRSLRPIPIDSISVRCRTKWSPLSWKYMESMDIHGGTIPGVLPAETSISLFLKPSHVASFVVYKVIQIIVRTGTGKTIKRTFRHRSAKC